MLWVYLLDWGNAGVDDTGTFLNERALLLEHETFCELSCPHTTTTTTHNTHTRAQVSASPSPFARGPAHVYEQATEALPPIALPPLLPSLRFTAVAQHGHLPTPRTQPPPFGAHGSSTHTLSIVSRAHVSVCVCMWCG